MKPPAVAEMGPVAVVRVVAGLLAAGLLAGACLLALPSCRREDPDAGRPASARGFPRADRTTPQAEDRTLFIESVRDAQGEARAVMDLARLEPGMTVADIGAGEGYYTVRLSPRVGRKGRVLAEDIDRAALARLGDRVGRERLDNVSIKLGDQADPRLPANSFDRVFLVHMYHEVGEPYAFLWHLRPALRPQGQVIVVDIDKPTARHGMPPALLFCEFAAVGFRLAEFVRKPELTGYFARFERMGPAPEPRDIKACRDQGKSVVRGSSAQDR